jgi:hypothetical protein
VLHEWSSPFIYWKICGGLFWWYLDLQQVVGWTYWTKYGLVVFGALREARLFANLEKCTFFTDRFAFLGYVVTPQGIEVDEAKIEVIISWPIPATLTQLQSFLVLAGFYRRFMRDFSTNAAPLNDLMKKGVPFYWDVA